MIKIKIVQQFSVLILLALFAHCDSNSSEIDANEKVKERVLEWNNAHKDKDLASFVDLYSDTVDFYQNAMSKNQCIKQKLDFLQKSQTSVNK